ncbi:MAG: flagellar biosynthesis protein FlhF, partial [Gammaproteobacteria bacterium]|nr:flagellar biosynthesis protein FlhF [Gammaproteobacteria bacterium]
MKQVRDALGTDALILSSKPIDDGYEILAMVEEELEEKVAAVDAPPQDFAALAQRLLHEVDDMRRMLQHGQGPAKASAAPAPKHAVQELAAIMQHAGFSNQLIRELVGQISPQERNVRGWLQRELQQRLLQPEFPAELFQDGVLALVGPTGVGKTTTTAKLAANYVMQFGSESLLLVTTDNYRVAAREQLKVYAGLLDVDMYALEEGESLDKLAEQIKGKRLVLIDTIGMSQRDQRLTNRIAELQATVADDVPSTRLVLLLNTASQLGSLNETVERFQASAKAAGNQIRDCILSKVDESVCLGAALDVVIRHGLTIHFIANGQRVPEDLELVDQAQLVAQALPELSADDLDFTQWLQSFMPAPVEQPAQRTLKTQGQTVSHIYQQLSQLLPGFSALESLWQLSEQPPQQKTALYQRWLHQAHECLSTVQADAILWIQDKPVSGRNWRLPNLALGRDAELLPLPLTEQLSPMHYAQALELKRHVFASLPALEALHELGAQHQHWISVLNRNHRVWHESAEGWLRRSVLQLRDTLEPMARQAIRYRGEAAHLVLQRGHVRLLAEDFAVELVYGEVINDGKKAAKAALVRRFWALPAGLSETTQLSLIRQQLFSDEIASLTRFVQSQLTPEDLQHMPVEVATMLATTLAATALYLEHSREPEAGVLRGRLFALAG